MRVDVLLIPETRVSSPRTFHARWTDADLVTARKVAAGFPAAVTYVTDGMCKIDQTIKEVGPLTSLSPYSTSWWPSPSNTKQWFTPGVDAVVVLWDSDEDIAGNPEGLTTYGGLGMGGKPAYATWAMPDGTEWWWLDKTFPQGAMVHEWGHGVEGNAKSLGFPVTSLHDAGKYGYTDEYNWREWYRAYFTGKIPNSITPQVWKALGEANGVSNLCSH